MTLEPGGELTLAPGGHDSGQIGSGRVDDISAVRTMMVSNLSRELVHAFLVGFGKVGLGRWPWWSNLPGACHTTSVAVVKMPMFLNTT